MGSQRNHWGWLRPLLLAGLIAGTWTVFAACDSDSVPRSPAPVKAVTTLPLFADLLRQVGGDRVEAFALLPSGADPHTFEPSPRDVQRIAEADVAIVNGLGLETPVLQVIERNLRSGRPLVKLGDEAAAAGAVLLEENPHLWLDTANAREYARIIAEALIQVDSHGEYYMANYRRFLKEVDELDSHMKAQGERVPPERRKLVTAHDAFPHLARYLGFQVVAVVAPSPGQEPSPQDIAELERAIREEGVPAVFSEPQLGAESRVLLRVAADADVKVCTLYADTLDDEVRSYTGLMRFNIDEIARCLGGPGG